MVCSGSGYILVVGVGESLYGRMVEVLLMSGMLNYTGNYWPAYGRGPSGNTNTGTITFGPVRASTVIMGWQCPCCHVVYSPSVERCLCQASTELRLGLDNLPQYLTSESLCGNSLSSETSTSSTGPVTGRLRRDTRKWECGESGSSASGVG